VSVGAQLFIVIWLLASAVIFVGFAHGILTTVKRLRQVRRAKRVPIASAPRSGEVEIEGRVVAGSAGVLTAPISGIEAVMSSSSVREPDGSRNTELIRHVQSRPFFLDDGSGEIAHIDCEGATFEIDPLPPAVLAGRHAAVLGFLAEHSFQRQSAEGMLWSETAIAPGDTLYVLGPAHEDAAAPVHVGYRDEPGRTLGVRKGRAGETFLIGVGGEAAVSRKLERELWRGVLALVFLCALTAAPLIVMSLMAPRGAP
jgi:hypothetical protein